MRRLRTVAAPPKARAEPTSRVSSQHGSFVLDLARVGELDTLGLRASTPPTPPPGHVLVRVVAAGLNFRDVLLSLGLYPVSRPTAGPTPR